MPYKLVTDKMSPNIDTTKIIFIGGLFAVMLYLFYIYKDKPNVTKNIKNPDIIKYNLYDNNI